MGLRGLFQFAVVCVTAGCVTAGPMPSMTFATSTPDPRVQVELSAGLSPGFYVSDAVVPLGEDRLVYGAPLPQVSGFLDPGEALGGLGISLGGRMVGGAAGYFEPLIRYRRSFGEERRFGLAVSAGGAYGAYSQPERPPMELTLGKGTLEAAGDLRITPPYWLELHALGGASLMVLSAQGKWCANTETGLPGNCPETPRTAPILVGTGASTGAFPAGYLGLAVDLGRSWTGIFHLFRIAAVVAGGNLPQVSPLPPTTLSADTEVAAQSAPRAWWGTFGLSVTLAMGQGGPKRSTPDDEEEVSSRVGPRGDVEQPRAGRIRGRVLVGEFPVVGATIRTKDGAEATSAADGTFVLETGASGVVELDVRASGYRVAQEAVQVPPGGEAELSVVLQRAILPALATVRGEVRSQGRMIPGVLVQLDEAQAEARTDEDGRFELRVPEGRYQLRFAAQRFVPQTKEIQVEVGQQALFYVELSPAAEP